MKSKEIKYKNFRKNLPIFMKQLDFNQEKLAKALNTDSSTITKWLKGKSKPSFDFICDLTEILKCTFEELVQD
jgi:transcriptional regulator with XRE-family HTH domain